MDVLEERFASGDATAVDFARALHALWGIVAPAISQRAFESAPVLANVREVEVEAVAYGDSMSDVYLFDEVGVRISVNGDHHLADRVDVAVEGTDLLVAYRAARELVDAI